MSPVQVPRMRRRAAAAAAIVKLTFTGLTSHLTCGDQTEQTGRGSREFPGHLRRTRANNDRLREKSRQLSSSLSKRFVAQIEALSSTTFAPPRVRQSTVFVPIQPGISKAGRALPMSFAHAIETTFNAPKRRRRRAFPGADEDG
jgi:hypothetical protein